MSQWEEKRDKQDDSERFEYRIPHFPLLWLRVFHQPFFYALKKVNISLSAATLWLY
jgi:hypothetical protein